MFRCVAVGFLLLSFFFLYLDVFYVLPPESLFFRLSGHMAGEQCRFKAPRSVPTL